MIQTITELLIITIFSIFLGIVTSKGIIKLNKKIRKKYKKNNIVKKIFKNKKISNKEMILMIVINSANFIMILTTCYFLLSMQIIDTKEQVKVKDGIIYSTLNAVANIYSSDEVAVEIADICKDDEYPIECVYDELPFIWDDERGDGYDDGLGVWRTPTEYMERGGVCRDITIVRKAIFNRIGIKSFFIMEPNHIYLIAEYDGKKYELNNDFFMNYEE